MKLVFQHGWGFDHHFWHPLLRELRCADVQLLDAGYFAEPPRLELPTEPYLAVGHSAGTLWFLEQDLTHCAGIIAINGFARFLKGPDFAQGVAPRILARMRKRIAHDADGVVSDFHTLIHNAPLPAGTSHPERLMDGLDHLRDEDARETARTWGPRLAWLSGVDDPLLEPEVASGSFASESIGKMVPGGHLLPLEQPGRSAAFIRHVAGSVI